VSEEAKMKRYGVVWHDELIPETRERFGIGS
jgi:hypothetical protein